MHGGFKVWLLNGCGPNLCCSKAFGKVQDFNGKNPTTSHLTFAVEIRYRLPSMTWIVTITPERASRYIYIYIHHAQCKHAEQESKCLHP